jgi:hypothetical protein
MLDLVQLLPHCKKDVKLDTKARAPPLTAARPLTPCPLRMSAR